MLIALFINTFNIYLANLICQGYKMEILIEFMTALPADIMFAVFGIIMAMVSFMFWCVEAWPFIQELKKLNKPTLVKPTTDSINMLASIFNTLDYITDMVGYIVAIIFCGTKLFPLALDFTVTIFLTGAFGFGGTVGATIGLAISNLFSIALIIVNRYLKSNSEDISYEESI